MRVQADFSRIPARHDEINLRLEEWSRWVSVRPQPWKTQPMFRQYRSKAWQWEMPEIKPIINTIAAHEIERIVSMLPDKHRTALRWVYVFPSLHCNAVQRELGATRDALAQLINDARDMVKNRLRRGVDNYHPSDA